MLGKILEGGGHTVVGEASDGETALSLVRDDLKFTGMNNSVLLEEKIATLHGYDDTREIYDELEFRRRIIEKMVYKNIVDYEEVNALINDFQGDGVAGLPFDVKRPESIV